MTEDTTNSNVVSADFLANAMQKAINNGANAKLDTDVAIANLALTVIEIQKSLMNLGSMVQQLGQNLAITAQSHNNLCKEVEKLMGTPEESAPKA